MVNHHRVGGWALPLWKMMEWVRQLGLWHSQDMEKWKNVPNHQPDYVAYVASLSAVSVTYMAAKVSWDDCSQLNGKIKLMFQTANQFLGLMIFVIDLGDTKWWKIRCQNLLKHFGVPHTDDDGLEPPHGWWNIVETLNMFRLLPSILGGTLSMFRLHMLKTHPSTLIKSRPTSCLKTLRFGQTTASTKVLGHLLVVLSAASASLRSRQRLQLNDDHHPGDKWICDPWYFVWCSHGI